MLIIAVNVTYNSREGFLLLSLRPMSALLMLPLKPKLNVIIAANDNNERGFISDAYTLS